MKKQAKNTSFTSFTNNMPFIKGDALRDAHQDSIAPTPAIFDQHLADFSKRLNIISEHRKRLQQIVCRLISVSDDPEKESVNDELVSTISPVIERMNAVGHCIDREIELINNLIRELERL